MASIISMALFQGLQLLIKPGVIKIEDKRPKVFLKHVKNAFYPMLLYHTVFMILFNHNFDLQFYHCDIFGSTF